MQRENKSASRDSSSSAAIIDDVAALYRSIQALGDALMARSLELAALQSAVTQARAEGSRASSAAASLSTELGTVKVR